MNVFDVIYLGQTQVTKAVGNQVVEDAFQAFLEAERIASKVPSSGSE